MPIMLFTILMLTSPALFSNEKRSRLNELRSIKDKQEARINQVQHAITKTKYDVTQNKLVLDKKNQQLGNTKSKIKELTTLDIPAAQSWQEIYATQHNIPLSRKYARKTEHLTREYGDALVRKERLQTETTYLQSKNAALKEKERELNKLNNEQERALKKTERAIRFETRALQTPPQPSFLERWFQQPYEHLVERLKNPPVQPEAAEAKAPTPRRPNPIFQWRQYWQQKPPKIGYSPFFNFEADYEYNPPRSQVCHLYTKPILKSRI